VANAAMWGFGATLGADAANAVVGEAKVCSSLFIAIQKMGWGGERGRCSELGLKMALGIRNGSRTRTMRVQLGDGGWIWVADCVQEWWRH